MLCKPGEIAQTRVQLEELITTGRLPITSKNIEIIEENKDRNFKSIIAEKSENAGLTLVGFTPDLIKLSGRKMFEEYQNVGHLLFVCASEKKQIE